MAALYHHLLLPVAPSPRPFTRYTQCQPSQVEILAFAIQGEQWRSYGQGAGYDATIGVIWDGLHYDALVLNPQPGAPEAADIRQV